MRVSRKLRRGTATAAIMFLALLPGCHNSASTSAPPGDDQEKKARMEELYRSFKESSFPDVPDVTVAEFLNLRTVSSVMLVDVRAEREQAVSMLPGAVTDVQFEADSGACRGRVIVTYCTIGARSGEYADRLISAGFAAFNLAGSVLAWAHEGLSFEHEGESVKRVHVYGEDWNYLPSGYEAVY